MSIVIEIVFWSQNNGKVLHTIIASAVPSNCIVNGLTTVSPTVKCVLVNIAKALPNVRTRDNVAAFRDVDREITFVLVLFFIDQYTFSYTFDSLVI